LFYPFTAKQMRILLVEDEPELARWLSKTMARHGGFFVDWANDGLVAERRLQVESFDAIVLDLGIPGIDGYTLLKTLRARDDRTPVIILTARDSLTERVDTLLQGADDFLPKPFRVEELEARLVALVRRSRGKEHSRLVCGGLSLNTATQRFFLDGKPLMLTPREYAVLRVLILKSGEPVSKQQIIERILPDDADMNVDAVEVIVHRLRKKLATQSAHIVTLRGLGYCLEPQTEHDTQVTS